MSRLRSRSNSSRPKQPNSYVGDKDSKAHKTKLPITIWPEWSDQEIASEKWDTAHKGKDKEKGKSPNLHAFEDPEGRVELPSVIQSSVDYWKRPIDFIEDKALVVVDPDSFKDKEIDLLTCSRDLISVSELLRCIIADVTNLFKLRPQMDSIEAKVVKDSKDVGQADDGIWKPWHHIWPKEKSKTGISPVYNPSGKYVVKVYWLGCWRKITVDDWMPFNSQGQLLLPLGKRPNELWPMLLAKALIKVASLDYRGGEPPCEHGDFSVIQCLTGWIPEVIPLRSEHSSELWDTLGKILPHWKIENSITVEEAKDVNVLPISRKKEEKKSREKLERGAIPSQTTSDRHSERDSKMRDKESKEKFLSNAGSNTAVKELVKEPEFAVFASFSNPPKIPLTVSVLREMADASEKLRQCGLSHNHPHSVMVTYRRDCPLVAPPPPVEVPRWRLIRTKKRKIPQEESLKPVEPPKEQQFLEIASPLVGFSVSPIPVYSVTTPSLHKLDSDDNMEEISEEGDKLNNINVLKEAASQNKVDQKAVDPAAVVVVETRTSLKNDVSDEIGKSDCTPFRSDKSDDSKDSTKSLKESHSKTSKSAKSSTSLILEKANKTKKMNKDQANEKRSDSSTSMRTPGAQRLSKADLKDKELKKLAKGLETKNEVKTEVEQDNKDTSGDLTITVTGENGVQSGAQDDISSQLETVASKEKTFWIEYDEFWKCFGTLYIYHKPVTYMHNKSYLELKSVICSTNNKKSGTGLHNSMATQNSSKAQSVSSYGPTGHHAMAGVSTDPPIPYLLVDSVDKIEIVICFTSLSKWLDPPQPIVREKGRDSVSIYDFKVESDTELSSVPPSPGLLVAEKYVWQSMVTGQPCFKIKSTGSKAAVLVLSPGRHILRFLLQCPYGYHVALCSQTPFTFGDEDQIMSLVHKESCRFIEYTTSVLQNIGNVIMSFNELNKNSKKMTLDLGVNDQPRDVQERHNKVFMACLLETLNAQFNEDLTRDVQFAWKAFDFIASVYLKEKLVFRPSSSAEIERIGSVHKKRSELSRCLSSKTSRTSKMDEDYAATIIQATFRGYIVRKLNMAYKPDTAIHEQVHLSLSKSWTTIENNLETFSVQLYRRMYEVDPQLFTMFPFYEDEWKRVLHNDYNGAFPEQPAHMWFLLFREVFFVERDILSLPKMYTNIPTCFLRVINNDTLDEIPKVFQRVVPYEFTKNKRGYTFLAEARTIQSPLSSGKFRLRVIGSSVPLPAPEGDSVNTQFVTKEIKEYYIPNRDRVILRYSILVNEDQLISVQLCTSKIDVLIKLQILDHDVEVVSSCGRGHAVIPVYIVRRDRTVGEADHKYRKRGSRPPSKDSGNNGEPATGRAATAVGKTPKSKPKKGKDHSPVQSRPGSSFEKRSHSRNLRHSITQEEDIKPQLHKYIIQALVLRDSWPLTRESWDFVLAQKNAEKQDSLDYVLDSSNRVEKSASQIKQKKTKDGKESRLGKNQSGSRPNSQQLNFDSMRPHWTLRVIADANLADDLEVKKDTERQDEIRAMKAAWEAAQPGRAAKAFQSRQRFLNENLIKVKYFETEEGYQGDEHSDTTTIEGISSSTSILAGNNADQNDSFTEPPARQPSRVLKPFDITPYVRYRGKRIVLDEAEENRRRQEKQEMFRQHKVWREEVEKRRDMDRQLRNLAKERQIQMAEEWQAALDKVRVDINKAREAYRQTLIVEEPPAEEEVVEPIKDRSPSTKGRKTSKSPKGARKSAKTKKK